MAKKSPTKYHNHWGSFADTLNLPNVTGAPIQDANLEAGDLAYVPGLGTYQCTSAAVGAAVWASTAGGGGVDRYSSVIIVGNSINGDTLANCHYLDVGDGAQLAAALAAAGAGKDVYIRPGTYDLDDGATPAPLTIPPSVRVRGAGRNHTRIRTKSSGDQGAFVVPQYSVLEDLGIDVADPDAACSGSVAVVLMTGERSECHHVDIDFDSYWGGTEAGYAVLRSGFQLGTFTATMHAMLVDCRVGPYGDAPSLIYAGLAPGNEFAMVRVVNATGSGVAATLDRCYLSGGDWAVEAGKTVRMAYCQTRYSYCFGVIIRSTAPTSAVIHSHFSYDSDLDTARGVLLDGAVNSDVTDNYFENSYGASADVAIGLEGASYNTINGNRGDASIIGAVSLDVTSNNNVVVANNFAGAAYSDLGTGNDLAHNK